MTTAYAELKTTSPDMVQSIKHPGLGPLSQLGVPFHFSQSQADIRRPPPMLGEHTDEVLREVIGLSTEDIAKLHDAKIVGLRDDA